MATFPQRVRSTDSRTFAECTASYLGGTPTKTSSGYRVLGTNKQVLDMLSKGYKPGSLMLNPAEFRSFAGDSTSGTLLQPPNPYTGYRWYKYEGKIAALYASPPMDMSPVVLNSNFCSIATQRAWAATAEPDADVGMMLAEAGQTLRMMLSPVRSFSRWLNGGLRGLTSSIRKNPLALADALSDYWLATRFGILPTISDIESLRKKFHAGFERDLHVLRRKSGGASYGMTTSITRTEEASGWFSIKWKNETTSSSSATCIIYYSETLLNDVGLGLGIFDTPNLLWELIPFSFVVDWVFDIGTWLRSIQPKPGLRYLGNCISTKHQTSFTRTCLGARWISQPWGYADISTTSMYNSTNSRMHRDVNVPIPVAPVYNPGFDTITHGVDALSLIWQRLPKLR